MSPECCGMRGGFWNMHRKVEIRMELCKYPKMENIRTFHIEAIQIPIVYN